MGYTNFKLLERGIPSAELLRRVKAYSERRFDGNLAELLALVWLQATGPQGIALDSASLLEAAAGESAATENRCSTWRACKAGSRRCRSVRSGWMRGRSRRISWTVFRDRDCASMDCQACGYCERIAAQAVSISPGLPHRGIEKIRGNGRYHGNGKALGCLTRAQRQRSFWTGQTVIRR